MKRKTLGALWFSMICAGIHAQSLQSPDGRFEMNFQLKQGIPYYNLKYKGNVIVEDSRLGLRLFKDVSVPFAAETAKPETGENDLNGGFSKTDEKRDAKNETWQPVLGEKKNYINHYNELAVTLHQNATDRNIVVKFRLFNDGLGFRYEFPQQKNLNYFVIREEDSEIDFPTDKKAWWIVADYDSQEYQPQTTKISEIPGRWEQAFDKHSSQTLIKNAVQSPLLLKKEGKDPLYINVAEAAVLNYPASHLEVDAQNFKFKTHLTPDKQGAKGYIQTSSVSPWRTIIVSPKAEQVLQSKMLFNLNEPTKYTDTSYIHPTKYMGVWWEMIIGKSKWAYSTANTVHIGETDFTKLTPNGKHAANNTKVKEYIDLAAENGFDGLLVEGWNIGWEDWIGHHKESVFDFITPYPDFDIKMLNEYAHSKGIKLIMHHEASASAINYERWADKAFQLMNKYGYDAVKTGYVGDVIPRGEHHYSQWSINHYYKIAEKANEYKIMVNSHESMAADLPENYKKHMGAFQFIKDVAADWDDTKILSAEPGDYIITARKAKGTENWFVGGITDENKREYMVDFSFLSKGKKYEATIYEDGKDADYINNPQSYNIYKKIITSKSKIRFSMARSGGFAVSIRPKN